MNSDTKILKETKCSKIWKRYIPWTRGIPGKQVWFNKLTVIYHVNTEQNQNQKKKKIILIDQEKVFDKIQYAFIRKTLNKLEIEGTILNMIRASIKVSPELTS